MLLDELLDPSGSADENVAAFGELDGLHLKLPASHCDEGGERRVASELDKLLLNLFCELPGRDEDERIGSLVEVGHAEALEGQEEVDDGEEVAEGLALAGGGDGHEVLVRHADGNGLHLDGFGPLEPHPLQVPHHPRVPALHFPPLPHRVGRLPPSDVDLMVFPEYPPVSLLHFLQRLCLPAALLPQRLPGLGPRRLREHRRKTLGSVFAFVPLEQQLPPVLRVEAFGLLDLL